MRIDGESRLTARLTVLAGAGGSGKDSVVEWVRAGSPSVWVPVPATTRPRRVPEVDGVHYVFLDRPAFERMITANALFEWTELGGHLYGTPREPIEDRLRTGQPVLLPLDLAGARQVRAAAPGARLVLLVPPTGEPDPAAVAEADAIVVHDLVEHAAIELVGLLGSFPTPAQPPVSG